MKKNKKNPNPTKPKARKYPDWCQEGQLCIYTAPKHSKYAGAERLCWILMTHPTEGVYCKIYDIEDIEYYIVNDPFSTDALEYFFAQPKDLEPLPPGTYVCPTPEKPGLREHLEDLIKLRDGIVDTILEAQSNDK